MVQRNDLRRLIELAFDYVLAETEEQGQHIQTEAHTLATEPTSFRVWLDLIDYIKAWNSSDTHKDTMGRASAMQFFLTRQT
jgi:hypothetical protein